MPTTVEEQHQAIPLTDPEAPPLDQGADEDEDVTINNAATLEHSKSAGNNTNNRRHDRR